MISLIFHFLFFNLSLLINEIQISPGDTIEWIELRNLSQIDVYGFKIVSLEDTGVINVHSSESIIFISKSEIYGNLIFNDNEDLIKILTPQNQEIFTLYYSPNSSFSENSSKTPPPYYSSSLFFGPLNPSNPIDTFIHFYIDTTPTPCFSNDDYGWISGYVYSSLDTTPIFSAQVHAQGINGFGENTVYADSNGYYIVYGLGIDLYTLCASKDGYYPQCYPELIQTYPESTITGINFYLNPLEIKENKNIKILFKEKEKFKNYDIFDVVGRRVKLPLKGVYIIKKEEKKGKIIFIR